MTAATKEPTVTNYDPDFHVNECARAARAAHARMMRGYLYIVAWKVAP